MSDTYTVNIDAEGEHLTLRFASERDHIARTIRQTATFYEAELLADVRARLFFPECAVDVGAHVGNHTLYFAQILGMRTIAFEPNPSSFGLLTSNLRDNGLELRCRAYNAAVGPNEGRVKVSPASEENSGMATVAADAAGEVPLVRLDDQLSSEPRIDVLKIDVEGWELGVLAGAERMLSLHRPLIYVEVMRPQYAAVEAHLRERHYVCWKRFNFTPTFLFLPRERLGFRTS